MIPNNSSAEDCAIVSPDSVTTAIAGLIRAATVPGGAWTYDSLAAATGLKVRRLRSYVHEGKEPSLSAALSLGVVLGGPAINALLAKISYVARPLDEADDGCVRMMAADAMGHLAVIARNAADGRIDHTEEQETRHAADALIATVLPLASAGRKP